MTVTVPTSVTCVIAPRMAGWSACTADFDDGGGAQTWTGPSAASDVLTVLEDLQTWMLATFGVVLAIEVYTDLAAPSATLTPDSGMTIDNASATAQTLLGWPAGLDAFDGVYAVKMLVLGLGGLGTWAQSADVRVAASQGAPSPQSPGTSPYRPTLETTVTPTTAPIALQTMQNAASPRVARVWDAGNGVWRTVSLGRVSVSRRTPKLHALSAEVLG